MCTASSSIFALERAPSRRRGGGSPAVRVVGEGWTTPTAGSSSAASPSTRAACPCCAVPSRSSSRARRPGQSSEERHLGALLGPQNATVERVQPRLQQLVEGGQEAVVLGPRPEGDPDPALLPECRAGADDDAPFCEPPHDL